MKQTLLLVLSLFVFNFTTAQNSVEASPSDNWVGYMNVFGLDGGFQWGSNWGVADLATIADADTGTITLQPNVNGCDDNPGDAYWEEGSLIMEASTYVEPGATFNGVDLTFSGVVSSNTLTDAHTATVFIKALDPAAGYSDALAGASTMELPASGEFSVSATAEQLAAGLIVQYGFAVNELTFVLPLKLTTALLWLEILLLVFLTYSLVNTLKVHQATSIQKFTMLQMKQLI